MESTNIKPAGENERKAKEVKMPLSRIALPESVNARVQETLKILRARGAELRIEELFSEMFSALPEQYWENQIERLTPPTYFLEKAKENPEVLSFLLKQAKKAFEQLERGEPLEKERKKRSATDGSSINDIDLF
jgi:hypothetical protein